MIKNGHGKVKNELNKCNIIMSHYFTNKYILTSF